MENWYYVLMVIGVLLIGLILFIKVKYHEIKEHLKFKNVLLHLVMEAEEFYGSKKGKMKFDFVYSQLILFFPILRFIPKILINKLVDKAIDKMIEILD